MIDPKTRFFNCIQSGDIHSLATIIIAEGFNGNTTDNLSEKALIHSCKYPFPKVFSLLLNTIDVQTVSKEELSTFMKVCLVFVLGFVFFVLW